MREEPAVVAGIQSGDPETLERVIRDCLPGLLRAARAAGLTPEGAEDAVQGSLLVFLRRGHAFDGRARARTWLHGILWRKVLEARRAARRDAEHEDIDDLVAARFDAAGGWSRPPGGPVEALWRGEFHRELGECLADLPERQRLAFSLREVEGFETAEICKILEVTANNLGVLLYRARNGLRECLEARGFEGSADADVP